MAKWLRTAERYDRSTGLNPALAAVCPFITERAWNLAKERGLKIYTDVSIIPAGR